MKRKFDKRKQEYKNAQPARLEPSPREQDPVTPHYCAQCGREMGNEWFLGPVCGKCCRANHRRVMGK